jgi:hypothetical protein
MRALRINSERGSLMEILTGVPTVAKGLFELTSTKSGHRHTRSGGGPKPKVIHLKTGQTQSIPFINVDFEESISPRLAVLRGEILGAIPFQERVIGEQVYVRSQLFSESDKGRPWVYVSPAERAKEAEAKKAEGSSPASLVSGPSSAESGYGRLVDLLEHARSVVEVGKREVDGQQTTEFEAQLYQQQLMTKSGAKREKRLAKTLKSSKSTLDLFLAPDGLPVRTRLQIMHGQVGVSVVADIFATEIPISVQPPPAGETITKAELEKLQGQEPGGSLPPPTKQEQAADRHFVACVKKRLGKHPSKAPRRKLRRVLDECERSAKRGSR